MRYTSAAVASALIATGLVAAALPGSATTESAGADDVRASVVTDTPCQDAPPVAVVNGAVFNNPATGDPTAVVSQICSLIKQAPAGSEITIALFVASGEAGSDFADELIAAHARGVDVRIILDGGDRNENPGVDALIDTLGTDQTADSWVHLCTRPEVGRTRACIGDKGMHNKFYLFSETGDARNVVVQSSANFTDLNSTTYWNAAVTLAGNTRLYNSYQTYFDDLADEVDAEDYYWTVTTGSVGGKVGAFFFPRHGDDAGTDTIAELLEPVGCEAAGGQATEVRVGMSEWTTYRSAIADRLVQLAGAGCEVKVVHGIINAPVLDLLAGTPGIEVRALDQGGELPGRIHSKYLTVTGAYDGDADTQRVFHGSPNYNETSLRNNDEVLLELNSWRIHDQFVANFDEMWAVARP